MSIKLIDTGFTVEIDNSPLEVQWQAIRAITAYKLDLFAVDEICMELEAGDSIIRFSESVAGWDEFIEKMQVVFPVIDKEWCRKVASPPFATNHTILYERNSDG